MLSGEGFPTPRIRSTRSSTLGKIPFQDGGQRQTEDAAEGSTPDDQRGKSHHGLGAEKEVEQHHHRRQIPRRTQVDETPEELGRALPSG